MSYEEYDSIKQFAVVVEQLEIARNFAFSASISENRIALVVIDNIAEIILYNQCESAFMEDEYLSNALLSKYSPTIKDKARRNYLKIL